MAEEKQEQPQTDTVEAVEAEEVKPEKKKKPKKDSETEKLQRQLDEKSDLLMRTAAEFDNYKKRTEREKLTVGEFAKAGLLKKILPILDNIDRAGAADRESPEYLKGIEMIIKQFEGLSADLGLVEIGAVGDSFDPNCHEAVLHIEDENLGENVIAAVLQKGYKIGETVVRPAMVQVAN